MMEISFSELYRFQAESNYIEGITGASLDELKALKEFIDKDYMTVSAVETLCKVFQPDARLRVAIGDNVSVGRHIPPPGGINILRLTGELLDAIYENRISPWSGHVEYETIHPFTDGNGRTGRAVWLWHMTHHNYSKLETLLEMGFLHMFYYQTLDESRLHTPHSYTGYRQKVSIDGD